MRYQALELEIRDGKAIVWGDNFNPSNLLKLAAAVREVYANTFSELGESPSITRGDARPGCNFYITHTKQSNPQGNNHSHYVFRQGIGLPANAEIPRSCVIIEEGHRGGRTLAEDVGFVQSVQAVVIISNKPRREDFKLLEA